MKLIILDTETSDIHNAEIGQLTYVLFDQSIRTFNEWFALDYVSPGATAVNGLTVEKLKDLSKGQVFSDVAERVYEDFMDAIVVCHNVAFDLPLLDRCIHAELGKPLKIKKSFCSMEHYTPILKIPGAYGYKWPKLIEVAQYLGLDEKQIESTALKMFQDAGIGFHDARFDVAATYCIIRQTVSDILGCPVINQRQLVTTIDKIC